MKTCNALHLICQDTFFALPIDYLVEVLDQVEVDLIPNMPLSIKGIFYYRGRIVPLIDLSQKLFNYRESSNTARIVIIQYEGFYTALYVNQVRMVIQYETILEVESVENSLTEFIKGIFQVERVDYHLLDVQKLLAD
ncbi:chemotaxis protein CheW [bacterium]|nr:chemotaxis protein CheW [bacterium]